MTGLATPPVSAVDLSRNSTDVPWMSPAAPPPPMIATAHLRAGGRSVTTDAAATTPASIAAGVATVSRAWSSQGT